MFHKNNNHFYVGAQAGVAFVDAEMKPSVLINQGNVLASATTKATDTSSGVVGELFAGYNAPFEHFILGSELTIGVDGADAKKKDLRLKNPEFGTLLEGLTNELSREFYANASFRFGKNIGSSFLVYVKLGVSYGRFKTKLRNVFNTGDVLDASDKEWLVGFNPGAGLEYKVSEEFPLYIRGEYNFYRYETFKTKKIPFEKFGMVFDGKTRPTYHTILLGLVYPLVVFRSFE